MIARRHRVSEPLKTNVGAPSLGGKFVNATVLKEHDSVRFEGLIGRNRGSHDVDGDVLGLAVQRIAVAAAGALADISAYVKEWGQGDQFLAGPWNSTMYEGKNYGIPLGSNTVVLWINTDMAKAAGLDIAKPPKTWAEFATWAEKMTNKEKGVYGTALLAKKDETGTFLFLPWVLQNGADLDTIDSPEAIAALAFWTDLVNKGYAPKSAITDGFAEIYQQFTTGTPMIAATTPIATPARTPAMACPAPVRPAEGTCPRWLARRTAAMSIRRMDRTR